MCYEQLIIDRSFISVVIAGGGGEGGLNGDGKKM